MDFIELIQLQRDILQGYSDKECETDLQEKIGDYLKEQLAFILNSNDAQSLRC